VARWIIERFGCVGSTMDLAARSVRSGALAGTVIVAEAQESGRGQRGRGWDAPAGTSLLCTAIARPVMLPSCLVTLPGEIAGCVVRAIRRVCALECDIKLPNDVMVRGRKVAGVLCQSATEGNAIRYALIGVGLNVNIDPADLPVPTATSLMIETGRSWPVDDVLDALLTELDQSRWFDAAGSAEPELPVRRGTPRGM
jgi:BirA family transcriptional regulator, biotin operon repressor / biotin---[acetyl-CoA-carboxylase] ligase